MSRAFRFLLGAREQLYRTGLFQTRRLNHPVVSVGNLTLGGTGKTPLTIALAERFRDEGFRPVVLSRGYKRSSRGNLIVSRGDGPIVKWMESGDEPFLIAQRTTGVAVVVGARRYEAGKLAERENLGNLFILDDGFQHRSLYRDVDLIAIDPAEWTKDDRLLPAGRWREPRSAIIRAHAACVQEKEGFADALKPSIPIPVFQVQTVFNGIYKGRDLVDPASFAGRPVVAFAGIAKPARFFDALERAGIIAGRRVEFPDHHAFTSQDIANIASSSQDAILITTEKDAVRLEGADLDNFLHLRISANIPEFDQLMELIRSRLP